MIDSVEEPLLPPNPDQGNNPGNSRRCAGNGTSSFDLPRGDEYQDEPKSDAKCKDFSDLYKAKYMLPVLFIITNIMLFLIASNNRENPNEQSQALDFFLENPDGGDDNHGRGRDGHGGNGESKSEHIEHLVEEETFEIPNVVLFPWFAQLVGILAYYLISRFAHGVPYTAVMFIVGSSVGFFAQRSSSHSAVIESTSMWLGINGEVILLTFLPGLLYLDSYNVNVHLFIQAFWQLVTFAFPMVLGGTALTALVAYYIFPYGWSFDLCMTFGSILAATDPVAVSVLLNELGAPPRLKIHISGESLMNDGSAVVFFNIFSSRFFYELGVPGFGEEIGWGRGFALFFRLSLGGACIGLAFGIGLVTLLFWLHRRLSAEENVIQVTATITTAYLVFYVSEILAGCSGIIAVLFCGLTAKALGDPLINDPHLTRDFWHIAEHLLNTTLFTLGGAVWGGIIANPSSTEEVASTFNGMDWLYLLILFGLVTVIRFSLVFLFYPLTSRIGIGQDWREAVFMSYGGLRGAVGIALALALNAEVFHISVAVDEETRHQFRDYADRLFGMVGGIAFLTLVVNGPTSGPLLKKLGLVTPTETREKIVKNYEQHMKQNTLIEYVALLSQKRFEKVDYAVVKAYVSPLKSVTKTELNTAVAAFKKKYPLESPNLSNLIQHISAEGSVDQSSTAHVPTERVTRSANYRSESIANMRRIEKDNRATVYDLRREVDASTVSEERTIFIDLLRREYERQIEDGELDARGFMPFSLLQSLDFAADAASLGHPLNDWSACQSVSDDFTNKADKLLHAYRFGYLCKRKREDEEFLIIRTKVLQALSFIKAHEAAQKTFKAEFTSPNEQSLTAAEKTVLDESRHEVELADEIIHTFDDDDVNTVKSQYACQILLHKSASYFENLAHHGLMSEKEANEFLEQYGRELRRLQLSTGLKAEFRRLSQLSPTQLERNIKEATSTGATAV